MAIHDFSQEQKICFEDQHRELKGILRNKAGADAGVDNVKGFDLAISEFTWRQVPLVDTQEALAKFMHLADDTKFSKIYGEFLNAPLGSAKEEAQAREMLCGAHGISTTSYRPRKDWELVRAAPFIALQADVGFPKNPRFKCHIGKIHPTRCYCSRPASRTGEITTRKVVAQEQWIWQHPNPRANWPNFCLSTTNYTINLRQRFKLEEPGVELGLYQEPGTPGLSTSSS
ncbi:hypothetical protein BDP55DRAFT_163772 [Colletotrichum godetiae]|uniref:Uncharacterized protein n=1 Tax=Colletotrichum godetiae TaxID=1209918 RepID=A0AAJ0EX59_9PEZI|nr:uncharacterized protein BDP55DRAFT_163772 [Colletotrichum godetiae]KAK1674889.1 hypothetical protein BDP55DRAFT_163772 [Colletotrichum godetiae]